MILANQVQTENSKPFNLKELSPDQRLALANTWLNASPEMKKFKESVAYMQRQFEKLEKKKVNPLENTEFIELEKRFETDVIEPLELRWKILRCMYGVY